MEEKPWAEVDGKEVEVEIIDEKSVTGDGQYKTISRWRLFLPIILAGMVLSAAAFLSITILIWALPVLLPILIVWFVIKMVR